LKLILQIALGVFLGTLAAQLIIDRWRTHQEKMITFETEKLRLKQDNIRKEQGERIRNLLLQGHQGSQQNAIKPPPDFVPDDAQKPELQ
jgi:hypothetical protein